MGTGQLTNISTSIFNPSSLTDKSQATLFNRGTEMTLTVELGLTILALAIYTVPTYIGNRRNKEVEQ